MDFKHYPFDSFDLMIELRFYDPTVYVDTTGLYGVQHPGVKIFPSSGGRKVRASFRCCRWRALGACSLSKPARRCW